MTTLVPPDPGERRSPRKGLVVAATRALFGHLPRDLPAINLTDNHRQQLGRQSLPARGAPVVR